MHWDMLHPLSHIPPVEGKTTGGRCEVLPSLVESRISEYAPESISPFRMTRYHVITHSVTGAAFYLWSLFTTPERYVVTSTQG